MPKSIQPKAKSMIHEMYMAFTKKDADSAYDHFIKSFEHKYPKAVECLTKDKEDLFSFQGFPAAHWIHIRTTNPISIYLLQRQTSDLQDERVCIKDCYPDDGL